MMAFFFLFLTLVATEVKAEERFRIPILVPITGFLSLEGGSQRDGALLALETHPLSVRLEPQVIDTGTSPEKARIAFQRGLEPKEPVAIVGSIFGPQMLALLPLGDRHRIPMITISGTAAVTEQGSEYVFRFFPSDPVAKYAHALYVAQEIEAKRVALITQTTAYGQSGRQHLRDNLTRLNVAIVSDETVSPTLRNPFPILNRALSQDPDVLVLHLHAQSTALMIRQAKASGVTIPIISGSAMHQPSTANLLDPSELEGVCAETASSPISQETEAIRTFVERYRERFQRPPDAFALAQFDGLWMVLDALQSGVQTAEELRLWLETRSHQGVAMRYRSDGNGNMAHSVQIICYDGRTRIPQIARRYQIDSID